MERARALVVDRDDGVRAGVREVLEQRGLVTLGAETGAEALQVLKSQSLQYVWVDLATSDASGLDLIEYALDLESPPLVVALVPTEDGSGVGELIDAGVFDVVAKSIGPRGLEHAARRCARQMDLLEELRRLRERVRSRAGYGGIVGRSEEIRRVRAQIAPLGASGAQLWLSGESGTGKELVARSVHAASTLRELSLAIVPCTDLASLEPWIGGAGGASPLGDEGGALYLDQATDLSPEHQVRLLRWLDEPGQPQVRVYSGAPADWRSVLERGNFLEPLYRRLAEARIALPALRERRDDIALLAEHFIATIREINHLPTIRMSGETLQCLEDYTWPGNVQELRSAIEHAVILAEGGTIRPVDLPDRVRESEPIAESRPARPGRWGNREFRAAKREIVEAFERSYLGELLSRHGGNVTSAAQTAGMLRSALQRLLRKYGIRSAEYRDGSPTSSPGRGAEPPAPPLHD